jgi:VWFA-related protein
VRLSSSRGRVLGTALLMWLASAGPNAGQDARTASAGPAAPDIPALRFDVVVTDAKGRPVTNLKPSDFELVENGTPRPLATVELRTLPASSNPSPIQTEADEGRAARERGTRVFAFYLDEFHVTAGPNTDRTRAAIQQFVDETLRPQDLAIVMRPMDSLNAIRFTRDRGALHAAIDAFAGRKGDYTPRTRFEELYIGTAAGAVASARRQIVISGLREIVMRLGELEADRAAVVFVSEGFPRESLPAMRSMRFPGIDGLPRASSRFHVPMYTFNPAVPGQEAPSPEGDRANEMLQWIADQTGGRAFSGGSETAGLARLKHDLETYYALTYQPTAADGRFHPIEVRVRRSDLVVQTRKGYWSPLGSEWRTLVANTSKTLPAISTRPLHKSNIIDTFVGVLPSTGGPTRMIITWEPRTRGVNAAQVVALNAKTPSGTVLFDGRISQVGSESSLPADSARFDVPSGRIELDMSIYDMEGKRIDTDVRDFDVPDFGAQKRGPMLLAPEVVRARTLRDFNSATTNPDAAPSSARSFVRSGRLLIRVPAFDASGVAVQVTAKVLNAWGQPMRDIDAIAATPRDGVAQFALPLSWLVPGQYQMEFQGTNANGAVKQRVAFKISG